MKDRQNIEHECWVSCNKLGMQETALFRNAPILLQGYHSIWLQNAGLYETAFMVDCDNYYRFGDWYDYNGISINWWINNWATTCNHYKQQ